MLKFILFILLSFNAFSQIDPQATAETKALRKRLNDISLSIAKKHQKVLIGQQNAFHEGRGWTRNSTNIDEELKSDMHDTVGVHPAVAGFDFAEINRWNHELIVEQIKEIHKRGGVVTLSWHAPSLVRDWIGKSGSHDISRRVVKHILPGGKAHKAFLLQLDSLADFFLKLRNVPIIFRPWHEHNMPWFWWGIIHCTKTEYINLWKFTADYLMSKGVHNLLYAYSPITIGNYFKRYPGDNYVDIFGIDHYYQNKIVDHLVYSLKSPQLHWKKAVIKLSQNAVKHDKIPAITEFGQEGVNYKRFWTDYFAWPLIKEGMEQITGVGNAPGKSPAFILLWRNDIISDHFHGPIPGHKANDNFKAMLSKKIFQGL
jgi:hypothetical protein